MPTTTKSYFTRPLALLLWAVLAAGAMMMVLASPAWAEATFHVSDTGDPGDGNCASGCTLREAITAANLSSGEDNIVIDLVGPSATITLASQLPTITDPAGLTIDGGSADITISGNNAVRVFRVDSGAGLTLNDLTVANGRASDGGGILNFGTLEVNNSTLSGNSAELFSGGIHNNIGGTITVNNSTISGNSAGTNNGGIGNTGTATVSNSTISGNSASGSGGGIYSLRGTLEVSNSTISGNSATLGGGIRNEDTATFKNTIVANSPSGGNCAGDTVITDDGSNLEWPGNDCGFALSADPKLGPLQDNGGPTQTHALLAGSAAIDAAVSCPPPTTDQRGVSRPQGSACDIGSFEFEPPPSDTEAPTLTVTHTADGTGGWNKTSPVTVSVSASDSGSGLAGAPTCKDGTTDLTLTAGATAGTWTTSVSGDGTHTISCSVSDNSGNSTTSAIETVKIDTKAPSVSGCSVTPSTLHTSANNHKLVTVRATAPTVTDSGGSGANGFTLLSVTSSQPESGLGPGDVAGDIQGWSLNTADLEGKLRAERYGTARIYTLTYQGKDLAGNTKNCSATVTVPKGG